MKRKDKLAIEAYKKKLQFISESGTTNPDETPDEQKARKERAKKNIEFMVEYYFPHYAKAKCADFHIEFANKVSRKKTFKGFAQWGRGLAKSVWSNIFIPFHRWINGESVYLVIIGQNNKKACQLLDDIMAEFEVNPRIIHDFGKQENLGSWETGFFITQGGFIGQALGVGQSCRGLRVKGDRPTFIVCDDLETRDKIKNQKRQDEYVKWVERDLLPTMDGEYRRFIYANNKFAPRMIQTILQEKHPKWFVHNISAYDSVTFEPRWTSKYSPSYYKEWEEEIGTLAAQAEFNNEPYVEGKHFKEEYFQWKKIPHINRYEVIICQWDVAYSGTATGDYNAMRLWGLKGRTFYFIDCFVKKCEMKIALNWAADKILSYSENLLIYWRFEAQFWNKEVQRTIQEVEEAHGVNFRFAKSFTPKVNKMSRIMTLLPYYQNGRIYYNINKKSHNDTLEGNAQLKAIEPGYTGHDDAPDADEQAIKFLEQFITNKSAPPPETGKFERKYNDF